MRLLILTPEVPDPHGTGGAIRHLHLARRLVHHGHSVRVIGPALPEQAERVGALAAEGIGSRLVERPRSQAVEALRGLARRPALAAAALRDPWLGLQAGVFWTALRGPVLDEVAARRPDGVLVEHDFAIRWALDLPAEIPAGLLLQNATWRMHVDAARAAPVAAATAHRLEAIRYERFVRRAVGRYSLATVVSEPDREAFAELSSVPAVVVPNGVDVDRFATRTASPDTPSLLFTGTLSYAPNAQAVLWFCEHVLPRIRAAQPRAELTVVGRGAPPAVARLDGRGRGITLTGWVDDIRPCFEAASVVVAPLRTGGGTKLKVLEAMAAGRPLVATPVATAGIDVRDGEHLLEASDPATFAERVLGLLRDPARREALGRAGRALVEDRYDWRICGDELERGVRAWLASA